MRRASDKIVTREALAPLLEKARRSGKRIVFANGCFGGRAAGHVRYLDDARNEGDVLVVPVDADSGAAGVRGAGRAVLDERARAALVAALRAVDYVVMFRYANVEALLARLRPDVHAKGT